MEARTLDDLILSAPRLAALREARLLDTPPERAFDRVTALVARVLQTPIAIVSLLDADREYYKSAHGLAEPAATLRQTPLSHSFCKYALLSRSPVVIADARSDPMVRQNLATIEGEVVAYAATPLITKDGHVLGTLAVIDRLPRVFSEEQVEILTDFATFVIAEIEARRIEYQRDVVTTQLNHTEKKFNAFMQNCPISAYIKDADGRYAYINPSLVRDFSVDALN